MRNDLKYYQQLLSGMVEHPELVTEEDVADVISASEKERGELAFSLLPELESCWDALNTGKLTGSSNKLFMGLITSLAESTGLTYENFSYVAGHGSLFALVFTLFNKNYPISFLVDYNYPQNDGSYHEAFNLFGYRSFKDMLDFIRGCRFEDIAAFLREGIPDSESLTDEMIFSISGVTFRKG